MLKLSGSHLSGSNNNNRTRVLTPQGTLSNDSAGLSSPVNNEMDEMLDYQNKLTSLQEKMDLMKTENEVYKIRLREQ